MDKMVRNLNILIFVKIQEAKGDVTITNDGATILKQMKLLHPAAKMVIKCQKCDLLVGRIIKSSRYRGR